MNYSLFREIVRIICLFLLQIGLLASNILAQAGNGSLELQVVAGKPGDITDSPSINGKYPAINALIRINQTDLNVSLQDKTNTLGIVIVRNLPPGLNNYKISWQDFNGDMWEAKGSVFIKKDSREKDFVELKRAY